MPKTPTPIIETPTIEQSAALPNFNLQYNIVTETKSENSETKNNENLYNYTVSL